MAIKKQNFSKEAFTKLADYLAFYDSIEKPIKFEVLIDGISAIRPTQNLFMLFALVLPLFSDVKTMEVILYRDNSKEKDKYVYTFGKSENS